MAYLTAKGVRIAGISAAVPKYVENIKALTNLFTTEEEAEKFSASTGAFSRHVSKKLLNSDLCTAAAEKMIHDLGWTIESVEGLVVVTQSPDFYRPSNAPLVQARLGLPSECAAQSVSFGCSGWLYGLQAAVGMIGGGMKRVLLCCGEGNQAYCTEDKSTYPLFGSAGTCTALEYDEAAPEMCLHLATDGNGWRAIHAPDGGFRNPPTAESCIVKEYEGGIRRTRLNAWLDGMDVFTFGITRPPRSIKSLCEHFSIDIASIDCLLLHQANLFLNAKIAKKVGVPPEKCPHNIEEFGNTSSATIPLLMVTRLRERLMAGRFRAIGCAFGVGLSWGSVYFETNKPVVSDLVLVEDSYAAVYS